MARVRLGIVIGPIGLSLARLDGKPGEALSCPIPPLADNDDAWREAAWAIAAMAGPAGTRPLVSVLLLPPLVQLRRVDLPRLRDAELRRVLTRDAGRYFAAVDGPQVIGFRRLGRGSRASEPVLAAAAPAWLFRRIAVLAEQGGWELEAIAPAHAGWAGSLSAAPGGRQLVVVGERSAEIVQVTGGQVEAVRRVPVRPESILSVLREAPERPVTLLGAGAELSRSLSEATFVVDASAVTAAEVAAWGAAAARRFELIPPEVVEERARWSIKLSRRLWGGAAALLLLGLGLARWDLARETAAVIEARAVHRSEVAAALAARVRLDRTRERLILLAEAERRAPRWTTVLGAVAERLPADAWLGSLRASDDSVLLEGTADQASGVFEALQRTRGIAGVQATAPIRQVNGEDDTPVERFSLTARLRPPADTAP